MDAPALTLELPEAVFAERAESAGVMLQQLGLMNVHLQIDRFGSARSALHHLTHLPVNGLKLAPSFSDPAGRGGDVVRATVSMAHSLALGVVANGVETREQLERMRAMDCDYAQGFALSPAVNAAAAELLLVADDPFGMAAAWSC
jgi:EAL domain-containing protein (putative c-di-GMP-specific phosphodiesterase class I)